MVWPIAPSSPPGPISANLAALESNTKRASVLTLWSPQDAFPEVGGCIGARGGPSGPPPFQSLRAPGSPGLVPRSFFET
eukprot:3003866-Pyramimonas_sp.AAC.1